MIRKKNICMILIAISVSVFIMAQEVHNNTVLSYNLITQKLEYNEYKSTATYKAYPVEILLANKEKIIVSSILPVYTKNRGYIRAEFLTKNDNVLFVMDTEVTYIEIKKVKIGNSFFSFKTYVDVANNQNYFYESILVHNSNASSAAELRDSINKVKEKLQNAKENGSSEEQLAKELGALQNKLNNLEEESENQSTNSSTTNSTTTNQNMNSRDIEDALIVIQKKLSATTEKLKETEEKLKIEEKNLSCVQQERATEELISNFEKETAVIVDNKSIIDSNFKAYLSEDGSELRTDLYMGYTKKQGAVVTEIEVEKQITDASQVGDPVLVTSGKFLFEDSDLNIHLGKTAFSISRTYRSGTSTNLHLGYGWNSIFDSCLIRGIAIFDSNLLIELENNKKKLLDLKKDYEKQIDELENIHANMLQEELVLQHSDYNSLETKINENTDAIIKKIQEVTEELSIVSEEIKKLNDIKTKNTLIGELNTYVSSSDILMGNDTIYYIDDSGKKIVFEYIESGCWQVKSGKESQYMILETKDKNDILSDSGFILKTKYGNEIWFDKWGLIEKKVDKNNNEIVFIRDHKNKRIHTIRTYTNDEIFIEYTIEGFVKSMKGNNGKTVTYEYTNNCLTTVIDDKGYESKFEYDIDCYLNKFYKPDGSTVVYTYGLQEANGNKRTTATKNELGISEYFNYDIAGNVTEYTDYSGRKSYTYYDENHNTIKEIDSYGIVSHYRYDDITENLLEKNVNGNSTVYTYDERGNNTQSRYSDGSSKKWMYNSFDMVTQYIDRDGIIQDFIYDTNGNLVKVDNAGQCVATYAYDYFGNMISSNNWNNDTTYYTYDEKNNVIKIESDNYIEEFTYDDNGRLIAYKDGETQCWNYEYTHNTVIEKHPNGLEKKIIYNNRQKIEKVIEKDTQTNEMREWFYSYDTLRRLIEIKNNETVTYSCEYYPTNELKREIFGEIGIDEYWVTEYERYNDTKDYSVHYKKFTKDGLQIGKTYTENFTQKDSISGTELVHTNLLGNEKKLFLDTWNRLVKVENVFGESQSNVLSSEGRILKQQTRYGGWYEYEYDLAGNIQSIQGDNSEKKLLYNPDNSIKKQILENGVVIEYAYDQRNQLVSEISDISRKYFTYDKAGRITREIIGYENNIYTCEKYINYAYSNSGRTMTIDYGGIYTDTYTINAWGELISGIINGKYFSYIYNNLGQVEKILDAYNNETIYEYNSIGGISKIIFPDKSCIQYEYNNLQKLEKITENNVVTWEGFYDDGGNVIQEKGNFSRDNEYTYDLLGRLTSIKKSGTLLETYEYSEKELELTVFDSNENAYVYTRDEFGKIQQEENRCTDVQYYSYNNNTLSSKTDFNGNEITYKFNKDENSYTVAYLDGSKTTYYYNMVGEIIRAKSNSNDIYYIYNKAGLLREQKDEKLQEIVSYSYNSVGLRENIVSNDRNVVYKYGKNAEILTIEEVNTGMSISFVYDSMMREIERHFANGIIQYTFYDTYGNVTAIKEVSNNGTLLRSEAYLYNKNGQLSFIANENGQITKYEYDTMGRLSTVFYPFSEDYSTLIEGEITKAGQYFIEKTNAETLYLSQSEYLELHTIMENIEVGRSSFLSRYNGVLKESFTYDNNFNRLTKTTTIGTIHYTYDEENRLIHSGEQNSGTNYTYDKNGNLLEKTNSYEKLLFTYNQDNRMIESSVTDILLGQTESIFYTYDAFGRRNNEKILNKSERSYLHDGKSHDILTEYHVYESVENNTNTGGGNILYSFGEEPKERYRYIDTLGKSVSNNSLSFASTESFSGTRISLFMYGKPLSTTTITATNTDTSYFGTDRLSSIRHVSDVNGNLTQVHNYDAFGMPIANDSQSINYAYTGKPYDSTTALYNYGYRDYNPQTARFTTIDPIRDSTNWYTYTEHDPVNFMDLWGLCSDNANDDNNGSVWDNYTGAGSPYATVADATKFYQNGTYDDQTSKFGANACGATSILNEVSERYTIQTGKKMNSAQANLAMNSAVAGGFIDAEEAWVNDWGGAANSMWETINPAGGGFINGGNNPQHTIYAWDYKENEEPDHFLSSFIVDLDGYQLYFDPNNGRTGIVSELSLQEGRPTRTISYVPAY